MLKTFMLDASVANFSFLARAFASVSHSGGFDFSCLDFFTIQSALHAVKARERAVHITLLSIFSN